MGQDGFVQIQVMEKIAELKLKLVPDSIVVGGSDSGNMIENFLGISLIEKMTGKPFGGVKTELPEPATLPEHK